MNGQHDDRILDACLDELLGGQTPPDLTERIMQRIAAHEAPHATTDAEIAAQPLRPIVMSQPVARRPARGRSPAVWMAVSVAASLLIAVVALQGQRLLRVGAPPEQVVKALPPPNAAADATADAMDDLGELDEKDTRSASSTERARPDATAAATAPPQPAAVSARSDAFVEPKAMPNQADDTDLATSEPRQSPLLPGGTVSATHKAPASNASRSDDEVIASIDAAIRRRWQEQRVKPAAAASDAEWCRRVYLDVLGRIPTIDETNRYLADRSSQKKSRLLDRLLESDDCIEQYALNWTNIWTALLVGRSDGQTQGSLVNRQGLQQWLRRSLLTNKPYDQFVGELVSATGSNTPGQPDFNGAVNFVLDNLQQQSISATGKTARLFLGMQVQCTQCHNHPFNDWKQDQFWELNAFFRQAKPEAVRSNGQTVAMRLVDVDFAGESGDSLDEAEVYWEMRNGLMKASYPAFVDGTRISPSGAVDKVNRRRELARLIVTSKQFPRALVNRVWSHFLGYGFTRPIDDLGPHNPPSHPELLDQLAEDFASRGFDTKSLIRWITLSEPYGLSSRMPAKTKDDPAAGTAPLFSYFYLRQMRAEELYESLLVASGASNTQGSLEEHQRRKAEWLEQFTIAFATEENDEATIFNGGIPQALMMFNGELMKQATSGDRGSFLHRLAVAEGQPTAKISQLFTAALSRKPTKKELQVAQQLWQHRSGDPSAALQDVWWAVLNTNEFILNH